MSLRLSILEKYLITLCVSTFVRMFYYLYEYIGPVVFIVALRLSSLGGLLPRLQQLFAG